MIEVTSTGTAKAVYIYLCRRADAEGQAFPTYIRIAKDVGFSERTVRRAIDALIAAGLLLKEARYDRRGFRTSNLYTLIRPSTVPEQGPKGKLPGKDTAEPVPESPITSCGDQDGNEPGCSGGTGGMASGTRQGGLVDQPAGPVRPPEVVSEATKEYPSEKYPGAGEEDPSVNQSVHHHHSDAATSKQKRQTDRRIDFSHPERVIRYYADKFGASERQVMMTMLSVQAQLDKGAVIHNYQAYFEKSLTQLLADEQFRQHFI